MLVKFKPNFSDITTYMVSIKEFIRRLLRWNPAQLFELFHLIGFTQKY